MNEILYTVAESLRENLFFNFALLLMLGILGGNLAEKLRLPRITGYILAGVVLGPNAIGLIDKTFLYEIKLIKVVTLGFVGFNIGLELKRFKIKSNTSNILLITFAQAIVTFILVFIAVYIVAPSYKTTYALILASIATVTTPTPIVACMRSYKTEGSISELVCPIVAVDDIIGVVLFSLILPFSIYIAGHQNEVITLDTLLLGPVFNIVFSILIGIAFGVITLEALKRYKRSDAVSIGIIITIAVLMSVGIGEVIGTSDILLPLVVGVIISNGLEPLALEKIKRSTDGIVLPLLLVFFTVSGADLNLKILMFIGPIGAVYIIIRAFGKVLGTRLSTTLLDQPLNVKKYLGFTLIPQGGVALDMAILAELRFIQLAATTGNNDFINIGTSIFTIILGAVIIYKIFGEIVVKIAFKKSGEINVHNLEPHII